MSLEVARQFLLWCTLVNYGVLLLWFAAFAGAHDALHQLHGRWFRLSVAQFDAAHYTAMAVFKLGILMLNLTPYLVLTFMR